FQAEDGIRDDLVTGVQTCALPISNFIRRCATRKPGNFRWPTPDRERTAASFSSPLRRRRTSMTATPFLARSLRARTWLTKSPTRSEERRVGKECRLG